MAESMFFALGGLSEGVMSIGRLMGGKTAGRKISKKLRYPGKGGVGFAGNFHGCV